MPIHKTGLYLHVPFCRNICAYCDFKRVVNDDRLRLMWMDALKQEIDSKQDILGQCSFDTLYLGGGTPSVLTMDELTIIMGWLKPYLSTVKEATIEANIHSNCFFILSLLVFLPFYIQSIIGDCLPVGFQIALICIDDRCGRCSL